MSQDGKTDLAFGFAIVSRSSIVSRPLSPHVHYDQAHSHSGCGAGREGQRAPSGACVDEHVEATTVDDAWARRFGREQRMDVLKLNVNGEEMNALRGARRLLSKRKVCDGGLALGLGVPHLPLVARLPAPGGPRWIP